MSQVIFEISGADYVGKSTQSALTSFETHHMHVESLGSLSGYGRDLIPENLPPQEFFQWWFVDSTPEQLAEALCTAYSERLAHAKTMSELDMVVVERGHLMMEAQLAAVFATSGDSAPAEYYELAEALVARYAGPKDDRTREIVLLPDSDWQQKMSEANLLVRSSKTAASVFTDDQNAYYAEYQRNLMTAITDLVGANDASAVTVNQPAVNINNALRSHPEIEDVGLPLLLPQDPLVIGLAGLSESGKGALAEHLAREEGFTRLKIGYFNESVRQPHEQYGNPARIALSAVHFLATNRHIERATMESLHGPEISAEMKMLLGDRWQSVFVALTEGARIERLLRQFPNADPEQLMDEQRRKDATKRNTGVMAYEEMADVILDNSGSLEVTVQLLKEELRI